MRREIKEILESAKNDPGTSYYGVDYYRGHFYRTGVGAVKKLTEKEAAEVIEEKRGKW